MLILPPCRCAARERLQQMASLRVSLFVCAVAVLALCRRGFLPDAFQDLGERGLVHRKHTLCPYPLQKSRYGWIVHYQPVVFRCDVDIAEADLLWGKCQPCPAMGSLTLFDKAFFVKQEETPANHYRALCELFCYLC